MTHPASGNSTWQDWPSTATLISALRLENIENAADEVVPGAWQALTLQNSWQSRDVAMGTASFYAPACRLVHSSSVELIGTIYKASGGASSEGVALLPADCRPARETTLPCTDSGGYAVPLIVRTTGFIVISSYRTTASTLTLSGRFPLDGPV